MATRACSGVGLSPFSSLTRSFSHPTNSPPGGVSLFSIFFYPITLNQPLFRSSICLAPKGCCSTREHWSAELSFFFEVLSSSSRPRVLSSGPYVDFFSTSPLTLSGDRCAASFKFPLRFWERSSAKVYNVILYWYRILPEGSRTAHFFPCSVYFYVVLKTRRSGGLARQDKLAWLEGLMAPPFSLPSRPFLFFG